MKRKKQRRGKVTQPMTAEARIKSLRKYTTPVPDTYRGVFTAVGWLPHDRPLHADGSTQCRLCNGVKYAEHLHSGYCESCLRQLEGLADIIIAVKAAVSVRR